jgi:hypothetical protein
VAALPRTPVAASPPRSSRKPRPRDRPRCSQIPSRRRR